MGNCNISSIQIIPLRRKQIELTACFDDNSMWLGDLRLELSPWWPEPEAFIQASASTAVENLSRTMGPANKKKKISKKILSMNTMKLR